MVFFIFIDKLVDDFVLMSEYSIVANFLLVAGLH